MCPFLNITLIAVLCSPAGKDMKPVVHGESRSIFSLTLYGEYVYWSDSKRNSIERANKVNGENG